MTGVGLNEEMLLLLLKSSIISKYPKKPDEDSVLYTGFDSDPRTLGFNRTSPFYRVVEKIAIERVRDMPPEEKAR